jgi:peptidoglycan/LPS O-acetylase OafA/YrhL
MIVVAPLATAAYHVPTMISAGNYTAALKCALFSSAAFLILAISTSLADLLTRLIETPLHSIDPRTLSSKKTTRK